MKTRTKPINLLSEVEVESLLSVGSRRAPTVARNRALIAVFAHAGLRLAEALALGVRDLDLAAGSVRVQRGKGGKPRVAKLSAPARPYLERWLDRRQALGLTVRAPLFCTLEGGALAPAYVQAMLRRYARRAGIEVRVHPHGLRHWHAARMMQRGALLPDLQGQLGHTSLATTGIYLDSIAPEDRLARLGALA